MWTWEKRGRGAEDGIWGLYYHRRQQTKHFWPILMRERTCEEEKEQIKKRGETDREHEHHILIEIRIPRFGALI